MGIFQSRPEEPSEWAGLPAEPWEERTPGEVLPPASEVTIDPFGLTGVGSIEIPLAPQSDA
ncbi:MAG: hypothetical protein J0I43_01500 [Microbacterium sp.]|uniref:hypothetical protein n=1 Tax=Microbacterium sp. TaxID=51671 RepID=UPI001AC9B7AB|nr:hypothetical protein [Microbacterium sp.]MBN9176035.1 hypothetical protein [Microbacterium sp.]